ncbi:indoleamine 2,3-dioxygenase 1 isoform X1 [Megalobrama amblycephala]|uniref:indoleamine 2,3-dioxygenase 1 isoform X1 n=1 Tax=Megalobrama amblycephala TaxID=75352 RepID=UPI00201468DE|nr:indoleamine 2,3-dioxygenase 1 isoform X1 [Megalobrama amblycephala]
MGTEVKNTDTEKPLSLKKFHISEDYGFILPEPLTDLPAHYKPWMDIARNVTELVSSHSLRLRIHDMPLLETHLLQTHRELRLAHLALSTMTMGYVWQEGERETVKVLPRNLSVPFCEVSRRLGLPPILIHADTVLANWKKRDPDGPFSLENLELLLTLPGGESVRGFFLVTLLVELAAVPGLKSILDVINGVHYNDVAMVTKALDVVSQAIDSMKQALKLMHEYVDPSIFYGIIRIYLSGWKDNPSMPEGLVYEGVQEKPMEFSGGSAAQSSILHCFDELLGVQHKGDGGAFLRRMRDYMPPSHKRFIEDISCRPSLRNFVLQQADEHLTHTFEQCVARLVDFRSCHINIVTRYITIPASRAKQLRANKQGLVDELDAIRKAPTALEERGTGGSGIMVFLKTVRDETKDVHIPHCTNGNHVLPDAPMTAIQKAASELTIE